MPGPRRRPSRQRLRHRPVPDRPVPRLRLLRGRAGLTTALTYSAAIAAISEPRPIWGEPGPGADRADPGRARSPRAIPARRAGRPAPTGRAAWWPSPHRCSAPPGYRVGTMPKPHLVTYRERITVDGNLLSERAFAVCCWDGPGRGRPNPDRCRGAHRVRGPDRRRLRRRWPMPKVDAAVIEVGLGGRLDATNAARPGRRGRHQRPARPRAAPGADPGRHRRGEGGHHQAR